MKVQVQQLDPRRLEPFIGRDRVERLELVAGETREKLDGRRIVNVNSTATGGGVAEMLQTLVGYARGVRIDADWLVIGGDVDFFAITKRIHNGLYGVPGDGSELGAHERLIYEQTISANAPGILREIRPGDIAIVHDPQPAGLIPSLLERDVLVVWRCHVGLDGTNGSSERAWEFVRPYVDGAHAFVFSRLGFAPEWVEDDRLHVIPPSIDPLAPKNEELDASTIDAVLGASGLVSRAGRAETVRVSRQARAIREAGPPNRDVPLVVQVSRWDRMKDMVGVLQGFVQGVDPETGAHLVLAGPAVDTVGDDPEDREIWEETVTTWRALPTAVRARIHIAAVPMDDPAENALVINALQRHAAVVVQKSLAEGFGLTVAEAMWKARPVVASAVGGISDQIVDGESGLLLRDPGDLETFGRLVTKLLESPGDAIRLGDNARRRVSEQFLPDRQLSRYASLVHELVERCGG